MSYRRYGEEDARERPPGQARHSAEPTTYGEGPPRHGRAPAPHGPGQTSPGQTSPDRTFPGDRPDPGGVTDPTRQYPGAADPRSHEYGRDAVQHQDGIDFRSGQATPQPQRPLEETARYPSVPESYPTPVDPYAPAPSSQHADGGYPTGPPAYPSLPPQHPVAGAQHPGAGAQYPGGAGQYPGNGGQYAGGGQYGGGGQYPGNGGQYAGGGQYGGGGQYPGNGGQYPPGPAAPTGGPAPGGQGNPPGHDGYSDRQRHSPRMGPSATTVGRIIGISTGLISLAFLLHIIFSIVGANSDNGFVKFVYGVSKVFVFGFGDVFTPDDAKIGLVLNYGLAALVYLVVGRLISRALQR